MNKDLEYIKGLEVYWQETDPDEEDAYYDMWMNVGEKYTDEQIQKALDNTTGSECDDEDFWCEFIHNLGEEDWDGLLYYVRYIEITDSDGNVIFDDSVDFS